MTEHTRKRYNFVFEQRRNLLFVVLATVVTVVTVTKLLDFTLHPKISTLRRGLCDRPTNSVMSHPATRPATEVGMETHAARSSWCVLSQDISVLRPFYILLTTRDRRGHRRTTGGDFFTAVLRSDITWFLSASVTGEINDYNNGSYLITFVPNWSGLATVHIELWVTSRVGELVKEMTAPNYIFICAFGHNYGIHVDYFGPPVREELLPVLNSDLKANKRSNVGLCRMDWQPEVPRSNTSCSMSFPRNHHWYGICEGPRAIGSTTCDSLQVCVYDESMKDNNTRERARGRQNIGVIPGAVKSVNISKGNYNCEMTMSKEPCQPQPYVRPSGYWWGKEWVNRDCSFHCNSKDKWWKCLTGRDVYFVGDSTIRQLFVLLLLSEGIKVLPLSNSKFIPSKFADIDVKTHNAKVRYRHHGLPLMLSLTINFSSVYFSADVIDAMPANGNEILVMSMIHHFIQLPPKGFQQRLQDIIAAIRRLRQRKMGKNIPIVFRTANLREFHSFRLNVYRIKWYNQLAVDAFVSSNLGVIVYDIFDMVASCRRPEVVHLPDDVMSVQLSHILSLVCSV